MPPISALLATVAGGVAMWIVAGLWHEVIAAAFYADVIETAHQGVGIILLAYLLLAGFMTFFIRHTRVSQNILITGGVIGAITGVLWVFPHELSLAAAHGEPLADVLVNAAWHVIEQGLGGLVIAATTKLFGTAGRSATTAA
jgi:hypothetical protein